ncbi:PulJ/GspJ family protein [Paenibacillus cremeus]|uniref:Prepilin-type N-terminal cleavage/methylation domain-containing protein n=1 Tax=Paenibacillus cremeus TaxID=2163881 RepID=A0A559KE71_9BACL|nr:prepilin-type N-terminal cleavage/methylation domain-containing protein [Paenibacillus cremeus]TVY10418.1 prepilin-type N-terminal cleavage/methylation domain-containing protein [Paenibacillus cremeus]
MQQNEKGMTLIEVLAALLIFSMVTTLLYSFLVMGISIYKRVTVESQMRSQGDTLYSQIISELKDAIYVQQSQPDSEIRYAKKSADPKAYIELYVMKLIPDAVSGGRIEVRRAGASAGPPDQVFQLGSKFTIDGGSLTEVSHDLVQVRLTYIRSHSEALKVLDNPRLEIDSQIPLFRSD